MLTKKQAQIFFFGGTILCFLIFISLSWHTMSVEVPKQTHPENISEQVVRGKEIWEENNCMGCHSIFGEGAYYAPELTKVIERRGEGLVKAIMMSKTPWGPKGRQMVAYGMSEEDALAVVEFMKWAGEVDLNGFPPEPDLKQN